MLAYIYAHGTAHWHPRHPRNKTDELGLNMKILILGATGMLGSTLFRVFRSSTAHDVIGTVRNSSMLRFFSSEDVSALLPGIDAADLDGLTDLLYACKPSVVINCIGLIKQFELSNDPLAVLPVNALFPHRLARICEAIGARLVHISTDCVFSGNRGSYTEEDISDAVDLYGRSKSLGELVDYDRSITLRTSIIGREIVTNHSLVDWFLSQEGSTLGYQKAIFSGVPTVELANIIKNIVVPKADLKGLYHVSANPISKFDLLQLIAKQYEKQIEIVPDGRVVIDRSLNSMRFREVTGYAPPDWTELIRRMYEDDPRREKQNV